MIGHLAACTLAAAVALAAAWALGRGPARWRYALLMAALLRFAVPTAWMDRAGRWAAPALPAPSNAPQAIEDLRRLLLHPETSTPRPGNPAGRPSPWGPLVWTAGAAACLWAWGRQFRLTPQAVRPPHPEESAAFDRARRSMAIGRSVNLRIVDPHWVPGAIGIRRPAVVLPDGLAAHLTAAELEGILAHELAHVARHDNLWAALARLVVAAFWFHPLVWWLERRLLAEREAACDELVVAHGASPETYLSGILKVCRMAFAGAPGYAGANGSGLELRMERIMNVPHTSRCASAAAGVLVLLAALLPVAGGYLHAQPQPQTDDQVQARSLFDQGVALLQQKDYDEALRTFRRSYELDPHYIRGLKGMVEVELAMGRQEEALALLEQESARHPDNREIQLALANTAVRAGKYDLAESLFQRMLSDQTNREQAPDLYLRLGEAYRRDNRTAQSIAALRHAVELRPDYVQALSTLALVLEADKQVAEAQLLYRRVLQHDPANGVAQNNLAYLLASQGGDLNEALSLAQGARESLPKMAEVSDTLGFIYLTRKEAPQAFAHFRDAVLADLTNTKFRNHLLDALHQMASPPVDSAALDQALRAEPSAANQDLVRNLLQ